MADSLQENDEAKKKSALEDKSKEDLVKIVKKQLILLKKAKDKSDDLSKRCLTFEEEKKHGIDKQSSTVVKLQQQVEKLEIDLSNLTEEKINECRGNQDKIIQLEKKVIDLDSENRNYVTLLNEKEERLQCTLMQLNTIKETCHCFQEELSKLQKANEEMMNEIKILTEARDVALGSLKSQNALRDSCIKAQEDLVNEMKVLRETHSNCVEENHVLISKVANLENEIKNVQVQNLELQSKVENAKQGEDADILFLMTDNQKLQSELKNLKCEYQELKDRIPHIEKQSQIDSSTDKTWNAKSGQQVLEAQEENYETQKELCEFIKEKSNLNIMIQNLETRNHFLEEQLKQSELENKKQNIELETSEEENKKLRKEIEKLASSLQEFNDFGAGFEHAVLSGAPTDSFKSTSEQHTNRNVIPELSGSDKQIKTLESGEYNLLPETCYPFEMDSTESMGGVEYALLGGGDISEMFVDNKVPTLLEGTSLTEMNKEVKNESTIDLQAEAETKDLMLMYKQMEMEKDSLLSEISTMRVRFEEYSSLLQETLSENESLKLKVEDYECEKNTKSDKHIATCTNTDLEVMERNVFNEVTKESSQFAVLEKQNFELSEKLKSKCSELEDFNFQLELVIVSIKQGVRQKTSSAPNKAIKELRENMSILKSLVDDLIIRNNTSAIKIKAIESDIDDLLLQKQALEDEVFQVKELNQFLEYEVEQLKSTQNSEIYYSEHHIKSPELYSIEEIDEKSILSDPAQEPIPEEFPVMYADSQSFEEVDSKPVLINQHNLQVDETKVDVSVQACVLDLLCDGASLLDDKNQNEKADHQLVIEKLNTENSELKSTLKDKTALVEKIHCEMDTLLEKIEDANYELQVKEDDLSNVQYKLSELQKKFDKFVSVSHEKQTAYEHVKTCLSELKAENSKLKSSLLSLNEFSNEVFLNASNSVSQQLENMDKYFNSKLLHQKEVFSHLSMHSNRINSNLKLGSTTLEKILNLENKIESLSNINDHVNILKKTFIGPSPCTILDDKCSDRCCLVASGFEGLNTISHQLLINLCNYLSNDSTHSNLRDLENYKTSIVPKLETSIKSLEGKLQENEKESKDTTSVLLEEQMEKGKEEASSIDLKRQLDDTENKMNKFKQIAMKLKKELVETKKQNKEITSEKDKCTSQLSEMKKDLEKLSTEQIQCVQNYQSLQIENDKLQDEIEISKENKGKLETDLSTTLLELNSFKEKLLTLESDFNKANQSLDATVVAKQEKEKLCVDLESKIIILESKCKEKEFKVLELESSVLQKLDDIKALTEQIVMLKEQLDNTLKEEKKNNLLDLEMADYERSINELNSTVSKREEEINELSLKLDCEVKKNDSLLQEIAYTETLKETEEKRAQSLKEVLEKMKIELSAIKESEAELQTKVLNLHVQLEFATQQEENYKLQLVEMSTELQHLKDILKTTAENNQRIVHSLELKSFAQKDEITSLNKEVEDIRKEFDCYKVRVHSVLKQQKSSAPVLTSTDEDVKDKLESIIDKFKMQVNDLSEKLKAVTMEYETLQEEHDSLIKRHQKAIENRERKDAEWQSKLDQINLENNRLRASQEEISSQHLLQNEMLVSTYKKQIKIMNEEHKRTVNDLQKQLESVEARLQKDQQKIYGLPSTPTMQDTTMSSFDIFTQERQEGEGSENTDLLDAAINPLSFSTIPSSEFQSLEKLLNSPIDSETTSRNLNYQDCEKLLAELTASNKKIEHLNDVLNDSESTNLRLSEQVRVLKEEVRRLERNKEREQHAENLEYLKNVFIKFATLSACSEKAMLIPVLTTMLKLSPAEQQQLKSVAGDVDPDDTSSSGWGSYLHRWSGLA